MLFVCFVPSYTHIMMSHPRQSLRGLPSPCRRSSVLTVTWVALLFLFATTLPVTAQDDGNTTVPTVAPSFTAPTVTPSTVVSPSSVPSETPTSQPTAVVTLQAEVVLGLVNVTTPMSPVHRDYFAPQLAKYLETSIRSTLAPALGTRWIGTLQAQLLRLDGLPTVQEALGRGETSGATRRRTLHKHGNHHDNHHLKQQHQQQQRRNLQGTTVSAPLATRTLITATQSTASGGPLLSSTVLQLYVQDVLERDSAQAFLQQLVQSTSSPTLLVYFDKIRSMVVYPPEAVITEGDGGGATPSSQDDKNNNDDDDDDDDGFFTLWAIVGIAAGVGVILLAIAATMLCVMQPETVLNSRRSNTARPPSSNEAFSNSPTAPKESSSAADSKRRGRNMDYQEEDGDSPAKQPTTAAAAAAVDDDNSTYFANASVLNPPTVTPYDADNQSYAYSLEPGQMDNQTVETGTASYRPSRTTSQSNRATSTRASRFATAAAASNSTSPTRRRRTNRENDGAAAAADNNNNDDDEEEVNAFSRRGMVTRQLQAPPGKLGIIVDTSLEGPVVHRVNENSPLFGKIFQGDIITSINNIDTRAMKASAITQIMMRTAHEPRVLTVASDDLALK